MFISQQPMSDDQRFALVCKRRPLGGVCLLAVLMCLTFGMEANARVVEADFYVSPKGNDAWSGRLAEPNPDGTDGPFATIGRAQEAVRELRRAHGGRTRSITVLLRGGMYFLKDTLFFTPEDSGFPEAPTVYAAYPGETPIFSGGTLLTGWRLDEKGRWQLQIPEVARGTWRFTQLFVNGQRRYRPRLPKEGYFHIAKAIPPSVEKGPLDKFEFREGDVRADWPDLEDIEVLVFHSWTMDRMRIKSVDANTRTLTFAAPTLGNVWYFDLRAGKRYILKNVRVALERPGEWYLDLKTGTLTYIPVAGETPETAEVIAPRLECLLCLSGDLRVGLPVEHLVFRGLTFAHNNWTTPKEGWRCPQSECHLPGAITANNVRDCVFDGCVVTHVGTYAMEFGTGCKRNRIENCTITDMAGGGIKIGEQRMRDREEELTSHNVVRNNLIAHGGRMHAAGMGIWIGHSPFNVIEHNEICDFYQTGISVGWSWGYGRSQAHDNTIAYNRIYHIGQGVTDDMGGIYTLGRSPGTVLHHNIIHDVSCVQYGGRGIYFDEGTTDLLAENNIVYRTDSGAFMQHYGRDNRVFNNIFALARGGQVDRQREEEHTSFVFQRNIVYCDETGTLLAGNWGNNRYVMDQNIYWNTAEPSPLFGSLTFEQWKQRGHDRNSLVADPLFVNPQAGDFTLRPNSPAFKIGFKPIDTSKIGRQPPPSGEQPLAPRAFPPKPPPPPPTPISEDFESVPVGSQAPGAVTSEENEQATIRVSEETAASGKRSLKFIDMPGQKHNYNPHMYYQTNFTSGVLEAHFDLRMERGMQFYYEWRDVTVFYRSGPFLRVFPDGRLNANGKDLMTIPLGKWVSFDIRCGLGKEATRTYDLTVRVTGEDQPRKFSALTYDPAFKIVHWLLFTAEGVQPGVCYVDNIRLGPQQP